MASGHRMINPRIWCKVNGVVLFVAITTYVFWIYFANLIDIYIYSNLLVSYFTATFRCYFYVIGLFISFLNTRKYFHEIHTKMENDRSFTKHVFKCCIRTSFSAVVAAVVMDVGQYYVYGFRKQFESDLDINGVHIVYQIILFVLQMFVWEIWFDFGHYCFHRFAHYSKLLYSLGHCSHHESVSPDAWDGFNITPDDVFLTTIVPHFFAMSITYTLFGCRTFSFFEWQLLVSYKALFEVSGHVGCDFTGHSFPIFPPLACWLGIDLETAAFHSMHHVYYTCNYAKRFSLWDQLFGTIKRPPKLFDGSKKEMRKAFSNRKLF